MNNMNSDVVSDFSAAYPAVKFTLTDTLVNQPVEDCHYLNGYSPKPSITRGEFLRMENKKGGADTVSLERLAECHKLASWHQSRSQ